MRHEIQLTVNGETVCESIPERMLLSDFIREVLGLTGTHTGCEHGVCGACTVLLDGISNRSCLVFAVQADGADIRTVEGISNDDGSMTPLQAAFRKHQALQCGYCTPGFLLVAQEFLDGPQVTSDRETIREVISGNLCRCTGYETIVDAVVEAAATKIEAKT